MSPNSLEYLFDPTSIGSLHRRLKNKDIVTSGDLALIGNADRSVFADPEFQEQVLLALEDRLPKRRGRPPEDPWVWWQTVMADVLVEDRAADIRAERKACGTRGSREPRQQAAEDVARSLRMPMCPETLLNRISAMKKCQT